MIDTDNVLYSKVAQDIGIDARDWHIIKYGFYINCDFNSLVYSDLNMVIYKKISEISGKTVYKLQYRTSGRDLDFVICRKFDYTYIKDIEKDFIQPTKHVCLYSMKSKSLTISHKIRPYKYYCPILDKMRAISAKLENREIRNINFLLHGPPGTGKSVVASSLGYYITRDVIILDPNNILEMKECFKMSKHIIIINELDKFISPDGEFTNQELYKNLLEFLDGSLTPSSSIIIIICNDSTKLLKNTTLTRSGRIHFTFEFGMLERKHIIPAIQIFYELTKEQENILLAKFEMFYGKISPADFTNFIKKKFMYDDTIEDIISGKYTKSDFVLSVPTQINNLFM